MDNNLFEEETKNNLFAFIKTMADANKINEPRLYKPYRLVVIVVFTFLLILGPFVKTVISNRMSVCECCTLYDYCCNPSNKHNFTEVSQKCCCEVSQAQSIPSLPLGISHQQVSGVDITTGAIEFKPLHVVHQAISANNRTLEYSIGLKAPPLYLTNSSFLI